MRRGFTLIELMIVVAIIAIIASIAIPNLLRSRLAANETTAISNLRTVHSAQSAYKLSTDLDADNDGQGEYTTLAQLAGAIPQYIDGALGSGQRSGYNYQVELVGVPNSDEAMWAVGAWPISYQGTGIRSFYIDEDGILRGSDSGGIQPLRAAADNVYPPVNP